MDKPNPYGWDKFAMVAVPILLTCFFMLKRLGRPTAYIVFVEFILLTPAMWAWDRRRNRFEGKDLPDTNPKTVNQKRMLGLVLLVIGTVIASTHIPMSTTLGAIFTMGGVVVVFKNS